MKKIVFPNGQTCNKFFSLLAPLAYAVENECKVNVLLPDKALADYPNLTHNPFLKFPLWKPRLAKLVGYKRYEDWIRRFFVYFFKKNPIIPDSFKKKVLWDSWEDRAFEVNETFLPIIKEIFSPCKDIKMAVMKELSEQKYIDQDSIIIGCHFRRGDYKDWKGGKYFFCNEDWKKFMSILITFFHNKQVKFFISTNERLDLEEFKDYGVFTLNSVKCAAGDLFALSQCDYIVGPPSTFSNWAALIGEKPLYHISDKESFSPFFNVPNSNIGIAE